tara:strand:- start:2500 stop:3129 length:630 start_codon:yes stop_codon:yes gene_type:complete
MTPLLFHGPGAREAALSAAHLAGRLVSDPVGDEGLKVDEARQIVALANSSGIGDRPPCLVIGPLDSASPEASDALLKTLEDLSDAPMRLFLWASYMGEVTPTIRSRTHHEWCPFREGVDPLLHLEDDARALSQAALDRDRGRILSLLRSQGTDTDWALLTQAIMNVLAEASLSEGVGVSVLWESLRGVGRKSLSRLVVADALLPSESEG